MILGTRILLEKGYYQNTVYYTSTAPTEMCGYHEKLNSEIKTDIFIEFPRLILL